MKLRILFFPLTLVIAFAVFILMIKPEWESLGANKAALDDITERKETLKNGKLNLQKALDEYDLLDETDRQLAMNAVPPFKNNDDFIAEIYKNMQGSGAFLVGTKLQEVKSNISRPECDPELASTPVQEEAADEEANVVAPVYCPPERIATNSSVEFVGSYQNIKDFVRLVDSQNRLTIPKSTMIERVENSSNVQGAPQVSGTLVKGIMKFEFYNKDMDNGLVLSNMVEGNDKVLASLLKGAVNTQAIDAFKDSITADVFRPVTVSEMGKADLFAK